MTPTLVLRLFTIGFAIEGGYLLAQHHWLVASVLIVLSLTYSFATTWRPS